MSTQTLSVTITGKTFNELANNVASTAASFNALTTGTTKTTKTRTPKAAKQTDDTEIEEEEELETATDNSESFGDEEIEEEEVEEEEIEELDEEVEAPAKTAKHTRETVRQALVAYGNRGPAAKKKAISLLNSFGVKSLDKLDPKHFTALVKALK